MLRHLIVITLFGGVLLAQEPVANNKAIIERLDQLEKQNRELLAEIKALREQITASPQGEQAAEQQEVTQHRVDELAQTKVEASQRYPIKLTGTLLFNAFSNGGYNGGSQDPVVAALTRGPSNSSATFRQTVLGLTFDGPRTFLGGNVSGSVYMDFFGGTSSSLNHLFRLRLATIELKWPNTTFAVGQDKPLVSRREPNSLAQIGVSPLTAAGNPWLWQPQARIEQRFRMGSRTTVKAEGAVFQTAEAANQSALVASQISAARPALQTRVGLRHDFDDERTVEIAGVGHWSTSHVAGKSIASRLYGVDWLVKPSRKFEITGLLFQGQNFSNLGALGGITLNGNRAIAIHGRGGWAQIRYLATSRLSFDVYGGLQDDRDRDLEALRIGRNQYIAANVMYRLSANVIAAFEAGQNRTTYLNAGNRLNNHYDLALGYLF